VTPDEHAAEAERILTGFREHAGPDHLHLDAAKIHALLATRPTPLVEYTTELTDGPTRPLTIVDYDNAMMRAVTALHEAMPAALSARYTPRGVLPWAKAAVDAFADTPTSET
jgi:hypothetical protein